MFTVNRCVRCGAPFTHYDEVTAENDREALNAAPYNTAVQTALDSIMVMSPECANGTCEP
jgi:hypothetical protein